MGREVLAQLTIPVALNFSKARGGPRLHAARPTETCVLFSAARTLNMHTRRITRYRHGKSTLKSSLLATAREERGPKFAQNGSHRLVSTAPGLCTKICCSTLTACWRPTPRSCSGRGWRAHARWAATRRTALAQWSATCAPAQTWARAIFVFALQNPPTAISHPTLRDRTASCVI